MKLLFVTMQFGNGYYQGTEKYLINLGNGLVEAGHEVVYLSGDPEKKRRNNLFLGDRVASQPIILHYPSYGWMTTLGEGKSQLKQLLSYINPDIVHLVHPGHIGINIILASKELNIPTVISVVDFWWLCPKQTLVATDNKFCKGNQNIKICMECILSTDNRNISQKIKKIPFLQPLLPALFYLKGVADSYSFRKTKQWFQRIHHISNCLQHTDSIIVLSKTGYKLINSQFNIHNIAYIPVGLEQSWFRKSAFKAEYASVQNQEDLSIGFAGTLAPHKGVHLLLKAIGLLGWTKTCINIAGIGTDAKYRIYLEHLAKNLNVKFFGKIASHDMPNFIQKNHLLVVPSIWPENQPQIVLESFSQQVPVIGSNVPGIAELIKDTDYIFEAGSFEKLSHTIQYWFKNKQMPSSQLPKPSSVDTMIEKTISVYTRLSSF